VPLISGAGFRWYQLPITDRTYLSPSSYGRRGVCRDGSFAELLDGVTILLGTWLHQRCDSY